MKRILATLCLSTISYIASAAFISGVIYNSSKPDYIISDIYGAFANFQINADGTFGFNLQVEKPEYYVIAQEQSAWRFPIHPTDTIRVLIDAKNTKYFLQLSGNKELETYKNNLDKIWGTLEKTKELPQRSRDFFTNDLINQIYQSCLENPAQMSNLLLIDNMQVTPAHEVDFIKIMEALKNKYPDNRLIDVYHKKALDLKKMAIGSPLPDIQLPDPNGKIKKLSNSLNRSYVLVDFWASWCGPCRMENPYLKKAYDEYSKKGFNIYSISLDNNADQWKAAIEKDGLNWIHVSDLKGWNSEVAQSFGIKAIPQNFLINKNGIIVGKNLRGAELEARLKELYK